jgi:hypothetical protein
MRVRLRISPDKDWVVESKHWYNFRWEYQQLFSGDDAHERARFYARALKNPYTEEIT